MKTGIFIYSEVKRKEKLKNTLYFLYKNYNDQYKHPVKILHRMKWSDLEKEEIIMGIRENCRNTIEFIELSNDMFKVNVDEQQLTRTLNIKPTLSWGDKEERIMNRFWIIEFWDFVKEYDYVMKLDDDTIIEEPIKEDFFKIIDTKNFNLLFNMLHVDCGIGNFGLKDYLQLKFQEKKDEINNYFQTTKLTDGKSIENLKQLFKTITNKDYNKPEIDVNQPVVCVNSFFIAKPSFWLDDEIKEILDQIDKLGYIYYYKWSLSSILSLITMVKDKEKISRCIFRMSNECHRSAYIDNDNSIKTNIPSNYTLSGCITSK
tara:strand:+ start:1401 stop:2351 length:951 start_codon:yes stop_codon:yes gene_type:complete